MRIIEACVCRPTDWMHPGILAVVILQKTLSLEAPACDSNAFIHELDMYQFFEHGIRRCASTVSEKYCRANNIYMGEKYNPKKLDAVNQYGLAISLPLPYDQFKWEIGSQAEFTETLLQCHVEASIGYAAEMDLEYP